jgi:glycerophosphoryl diester phosphodiesterase
LGHRGSPKVAPENTLASFQKAREAGADGVELDVMLSADQEVVVIHDDCLERTTTGRGRVRDLALAALQALDAGSWFGPAFAGERMPTLREVCEWAGADMLLNIELKNLDLGYGRLVEKTVAIIRECGLQDRVLFSSFNPLAIHRVKQIQPGLSTGLLYAPGLPLPLARAWLRPWARPDALHPHHALATDGYVRWAKAKGYRVNVWTPDTGLEMHRLITLKVDGIITNLPDALARLSPRRGKHGGENGAPAGAIGALYD